MKFAFFTTPLMETIFLKKEELIMIKNGDMFYKKRVIKVKPETPMVSVMAILQQSGVILPGRWEIDYDDGTIIRFLATDTQWILIGYLLDHKNEIEKGVQDNFKKEKIEKGIDTKKIKYDEFIEMLNRFKRDRD